MQGFGKTTSRTSRTRQARSNLCMGCTTSARADAQNLKKYLEPKTKQHDISRAMQAGRTAQIRIGSSAVSRGGRTRRAYKAGQQRRQRGKQGGSRQERAVRRTYSA